MNDYISREAVLKTLCKYCDPEPDGSISCDGCHPPCADYEDFKTIPAADVAPVVHAEWIKNDNGTWSCSKCKSWIPNEQHYYARFCLHCGAVMDAKREDKA